MTQRSWLFIPGDSERKLAKVPDIACHAVVIDLEDAVAPALKDEARRNAGAWLAANLQIGRGRYVRINSLGTSLWRNDLEAVLPGRPDGVLVPKVSGPDQLHQLMVCLDDMEPRLGIARGQTKIIPMLAESSVSALAITDFAASPHARLAGLAWGSEDLASALGASRKRSAFGEWIGAFAQVRANLLLAAKALGVLAIDTVEPEFRDLDKFRRFAEASVADGFDGMLCIHPDQVASVNKAFNPSEEALAHAKEIVAAFAAQPHAAALNVGGSMVERLHLEQARKLLEE